MIELSIQSTLDELTESKIFEWSEDNLKTQLPLKPSCNASFTLYLYAATDFIAPHIRNGKLINYILSKYLIIELILFQQISAAVPILVIQIVCYHI